MILRPKTSLHLHGTLLSTPAGVPVATVPDWLRRAVPDAQRLAAHGAEDIVLAAGTALGALDAVVRRHERWAGAWRQRLALSAAAATAKQAGRVEDENALRDAVLLTRPGDEVGPAGRMLLAWRRQAAWPAEKLLMERCLAEVLEDLGHASDDDAVSDLADELRQVSTSIGLVGMVTGAFMAAERHSYGWALGAWLADSLLAQRLGWMHAVPLLGPEVAFGAGVARRRRDDATGASAAEAQGDRAKGLLAAQARAALRAIDLSAELGRRADKLLAVSPKLRAKAADSVVERLLSDDAVIASEQIAGMSDRGLRRLFDRLVELGAVRELSGRATFRIYGI